ncbi:MAG: hypothetical protein H6841_09590 [Planctomycetes bacterium]|nr:hypothetical protein [Planctomycetota bacterium]MCB9935383.1 hypothetical protein [Planctomycetota bacterium]
MKVTAILLGVPLVFAALLASVTYAFDRFAGDPQPVYADGASVEKADDGYAVTTLRVGDVEYLVISAAMPLDGERKDELKHVPRHFVTIYEVVRKGEGKAELILVGSRCVEWDRGFELINFKPDSSSPSKLRGSRD